MNVMDAVSLALPVAGPAIGVAVGWLAGRRRRKTLSITDMAQARTSVPDLVVSGDPGAWEVVCKASSVAQGWMRSTKRMAVAGGTLYQVSTEHRVDGCVVAVAEALAFVPAPDQAPTT